MYTAGRSWLRRRCASPSHPLTAHCPCLAAARVWPPRWLPALLLLLVARAPPVHDPGCAPRTAHLQRSGECGIGARMTRGCRIRRNRASDRIEWGKCWCSLQLAQQYWMGGPASSAACFVPPSFLSSRSTEPAPPPTTPALPQPSSAPHPQGRCRPALPAPAHAGQGRCCAARRAGQRTRLGLHQQQRQPSRHATQHGHLRGRGCRGRQQHAAQQPCATALCHQLHLCCAGGSCCSCCRCWAGGCSGVRGPAAGAGGEGRW